MEGGFNYHEFNDEIIVQQRCVVGFKIHVLFAFLSH